MAENLLMNPKDLKNSNSPNKASVKFGLTLSTLFFCLYLVNRIYQISISDLSMALAGGITQIIIFGIPATLAILLIGWSVAYVYYWLRYKIQPHRGLLLAAFLVLFFLIAGLTRIVYYGYLASKASNSNSADELLAISQSSLVNQYSGICHFIKENPNFDIHLALKMRKRSQCYLDEYFASNPNTPADILIELSQQKFCSRYILKLLLENKQLPAEAKEIISKNCPEIPK